MRTLKGQRAQTAIEIAVFGSILIFALGAIIRGGVNRGNQQNAVFKATRMALTLSYDTSANMDNASRNTASVLVVEDRLTAGSSKYGPIDRSPTLMSGSASHSANVLMPIDFGDVEDIGVFDIFVNGQHIALSTSAFKTINLFEGGCPTGECLSQVWIEKPFENFDTTTLPILLTGDPTSPGSAPRYIEKCSPCPATEANCIGGSLIAPCANASPCDATCSSCAADSLETYIVSTSAVRRCALLYSVVPNHPDMDKWCNGGTIPCTPPQPCSTSAVPGCNLSAAERFDLDRDGSSDVPGPQWARFSWQWYRVMGFKESEATPPVTNLSSPPGTAVAYNGLLVGDGINVDEGKNISVDVDQDLQMESVRAVYHVNDQIVALDVVDSQEGDFTFSERNVGIPPGFTRDINVYTRNTSSGTYLRIEEGRLFSGPQFIRTASKKDVVDYIERGFKISNDTGRLCYEGVPQPALGPDPDKLACNNCFSANNRLRTCFDPDSLFLWIRSAVSDYHGHKWITDVSNDPYVDFTR